jgi:hypothetical protein
MVNLSCLSPKADFASRSRLGSASNSVVQCPQPILKPCCNRQAQPKFAPSAQIDRGEHDGPGNCPTKNKVPAANSLHMLA